MSLRFTLLPATPWRSLVRSLVCVSLAVALFSGCGTKPEAKPAAPPSAGPAGAAEAGGAANAANPQAKLIQDLEGMQGTLQAKQTERRELLIRRRAELEQLTSLLRIRISAAGLDMDEAPKLLVTPGAERGPHAELVGEYGKVARLRVQVIRLTKVVADDRALLGKLDGRLEELQYKLELNTAVSEVDRGAAQKILDDAELNSDSVARGELTQPEQADELNAAFTQLGDSLKKRVSLLPARPEKKREDLPALPKLEFKAADLAEKVLLETLQEVLAEGDAEADKQLLAGHPESAIAALRKALAQAQADLTAFKKSPEWSTECGLALSRFSEGLSEQMAGPYLTALEAGIPVARKQKDWAPVLGLLEELARIAPQTKKLDELIPVLRTLLEWRVTAGDIEARVALERFNEILRQLKHPLVPVLAGTGTQAGELLVITLNGIELHFRWCPPGAFQMGSPDGESGHGSDETQVSVTLTQVYWMLETEVTQELWTAIMGTTIQQQAKLGSDSVRGVGPQFPAYDVSHEEAVAFCRKLTSALHQLGAGHAAYEIRLPTEAEWEYACRAGTTTAYHFGDSAAQLGEYAWFEGNSGNTAQPVGTKKENAWGLKDMHGSLWEWCQDVYESKLPGGENPHVSSGGSNRVFRGGSWYYSAGRCRSAYRLWYSPVFRYDYLGFRVARVPSSK